MKVLFVACKCSKESTPKVDVIKSFTGDIRMKCHKCGYSTGEFFLFENVAREWNDRNGDSSKIEPLYYFYETVFCGRTYLLIDHK